MQDGGSTFWLSTRASAQQPRTVRVYFDLRALDRPWSGRGPKNRLRDAPLFQVGELLAIDAEHEEANRRRKILVLALPIDRGHQLRQGNVARLGDFLQRVPERIF